jgi:toxin ParE1/3/4
MPSYELTSDAEADLEKIAAYTLREWGAEQQIRYAELLEAGFHRIASGMAISRQFSEHYPQIRVTRCEHHYVFHLQGEETTAPRIIAVLHERMDMIARLRRRL